MATRSRYYQKKTEEKKSLPGYEFGRLTEESRTELKHNSHSFNDFSSLSSARTVVLPEIIISSEATDNKDDQEHASGGDEGVKKTRKPKRYQRTSKVTLADRANTDEEKQTSNEEANDMKNTLQPKPKTRKKYQKSKSDSPLFSLSGLSQMAASTMKLCKAMVEHVQPDSSEKIKEVKKQKRYYKKSVSDTPVYRKHKDELGSETDSAISFRLDVDLASTSLHRCSVSASDIHSVMSTTSSLDSSEGSFGEPVWALGYSDTESETSEVFLQCSDTPNLSASFESLPNLEIESKESLKHTKRYRKSSSDNLKPVPRVENLKTTDERLTEGKKKYRRSSSDKPALGRRLLHQLSLEGKPRNTRKTWPILQENNKRFNITDLFDAVEHQDMDLAKLILEAEDLDVNSMNEEELTPLDVAVMTNHVPMAKMLLTLGAKENPKFLQENRSLQLNMLMNDTYKKVVDLTSMVVNSGGNIGSGKDYDRELSHWEFRHRLLKRMKAGYEHARVPDAPASARLSVASAEALTVRFDEPDQHNGAVVTRYKVEWSCFETFSPLAGEAILEDVRHLEYDIPGLTQGNVYYVQVTAWNIKGWGPPTPTNPPYAIPSSWREVSGVKPRNEGKLQLLDDLFSQVRASRPADASEIKDNQPTGSPSYQRKNTVRKSIKNLFTSAPKFQKNLKRGVYLASLVYNEDKILVTNEDHLPIVEVDENFSSASLHSDFHWMMKIACTWEDVKSLRQDIEKISSSSLVHFRSKLLQAAAQLQTALGIQDLGQFFYKPIKDSNGSIVLMTVNNIREPKQVNSAAMKWMPFSKVHKRMSVSDAGLVCPELLMTMVNEMILYHQLSTMVLPKGLYLGYLKLKSTVDLIRMLVAEKSPNVLPYTKIRNCPNVSKEEWEWLQSLGVNEAKSDPTQAQQDFCGQLVESTKRLLETLGVSDDEAVTHRLFEMEVIEFSPDVCFILLLPPVEAVCSVPGHNDEMTDKTDFLALPVQVFEMIHMCSYQYEFISRYSRLSSILEMDTCLAQQAQREAFSSEELAVAKERIEQLTKFQQILDEAWKSMRWTMEVITYARDRGVRGGVPLGVLYAPPPSPNDSPLPNRKDVESTSSDAGYHSDKGSSTDLHSSETATVPSTGQQQGDVDMGCDDLQLLINTQNNNKPGILRVYAAYDTGLADGTSVKLHVTPKTSSREVINLVVQQLNKAVKTKGLQGPYYAEDQLEEFCLVAVIGARERILRDDYQPLQLQNPWTKGRLFVRLKSNLLAALEQGTATAV